MFTYDMFHKFTLAGFGEISSFGKKSITGVNSIYFFLFSDSNNIWDVQIGSYRGFTLTDLESSIGFRSLVWSKNFD